MKDQFDPKRFTGKAFIRRKASPDSKTDYAIVIDGLIAGRIMKKRSAFIGSRGAGPSLPPIFPSAPLRTARKKPMKWHGTLSRNCFGSGMPGR